MPRYIDLDKAIQDVESVGAYYSEEEEVKEQCLLELKGQPIADVVPRSEVEKAKQEVASDIFDKLLSHTSVGIRLIKELINEEENSNVKKCLMGRFNELLGMEKFIAELKNNYIGE